MFDNKAGYENLEEAARYGSALSVTEACEVINWKRAIWQDIRAMRLAGATTHTRPVIDAATRLRYYEVALTVFAEKHLILAVIRELEKDGEEFLLPVRVGVRA
jgi:hypothetical protein